MSDNMRAELEWLRDSWHQAQQALTQNAERMDDHTYSELASIINDSWDGGAA